MKILFTAAQMSDPLRFYREMLEGLNALPDVSIDFFDEQAKDVDIVLLMGIDPAVHAVRQKHPQARIGLVDPRRAEGETLDADFVVVQGLEQENWFSNYYLDLFRYDFHPVVSCQPRTHRDTETLVVGYHGNKVHLQTMFPHVTTALEQLGRERAVELRAFYNMEDHGELDPRLLPEGVRFVPRPWRWEMFESEFDEIDIGVVPNLIPIRRGERARRRIVTCPPLFNEHPTDYLMRFKGTSNIGRLYPFACRGVPVVADLFPSACQLIEHGHDGMLAGSAGMWYRSMCFLAASPQRREEMGQRMLEKYWRTGTPEVLNPGLAAFLREMLDREPRHSPAAFSVASNRLNETSFSRAATQERRRRRGRSLAALALRRSLLPGAVPRNQ